MVKSILLGDVQVGPDEHPYVIAEIGSNHNGDMNLCLELIDAAVAAGANAVKFQSWSEESLISKQEYEKNTEYSDKKKHFGSLREMVRAYQLSDDQHRQAAAHCRDRGIEFCSTPFSEAEVDLLDDLEVPFFKIASMDVDNLPLVRYAARKGKPLLLSTGMASMAEICRLVEAVREVGSDQIVLLHCVSLYPPDVGLMNLRNIKMLRDVFDVPTGFSDHSIGTALPLAAIALGACLVEKHFTLDTQMDGWDHAISAEPGDLSVIVEQGRAVRAALGVYQRVVSEEEQSKRTSFRRSIVVRGDLPVGHVLTPTDLTAKRPGTGISPSEQPNLWGRTLARAVEADQVLQWDDLV